MLKNKDELILKLVETVQTVFALSTVPWIIDALISYFASNMQRNNVWLKTFEQ